MQNSTSKTSDCVLLCKPLGSWILSTAVKADLLQKSQIDEIANVMSQLNLYAMRICKKFKVSACTDITGFGLLGHAFEMARDVTLKIYQKDVPILQSVKDMANMGIIPAGAYANRDFVSVHVQGEADIELYDAQTSGGLLFAINPDEVHVAKQELIEAGYIHTSIIGEVVQKGEKSIIVV